MSCRGMSWRVLPRLNAASADVGNARIVVEVVDGDDLDPSLDHRGDVCLGVFDIGLAACEALVRGGDFVAGHLVSFRVSIS